MKEAIKKELTHREYNIPTPFMEGVNHVLTTFMGKKYNCEYTIIDDIKMAAHNEFFRGAQYYLFKIGNVIPKTNFTTDITTMRARWDSFSCWLRKCIDCTAIV